MHFFKASNHVERARQHVKGLKGILEGLTEALNPLKGP